MDDNIVTQEKRLEPSITKSVSAYGVIPFNARTYALTSLMFVTVISADSVLEA